MKTPTALSATSSQREQTSLRSQAPRLPRSNVCSTRDLENPSASVHRKRFSTPSLTLKVLCAGKLNPRDLKNGVRRRKVYEDRNARISILARGLAPRPDTLKQTANGTLKNHLQTGRAIRFLNVSMASASCRKAFGLALT